MWLKWPKLTFPKTKHLCLKCSHADDVTLNSHPWTRFQTLFELTSWSGSETYSLRSLQTFSWYDSFSESRTRMHGLQWTKKKHFVLDKDRTTWQNRFNGGDSPLYHRVPVTALLKALLQRQTQTPEHRITQKTSTKLLLSVERSGSTCTGGCCDLGEGFPAARSDPPETQEENTLKSLHFNTKPAERKSFKRKMDFRFSLF